MLDAMPTRLLMQWRAFASEEPFGFESQNLLLGNVARWVGVAGGSKRTSIEDYMLRFRKAAQQSTKSIMAAARSMAVAVEGSNNGRTGGS